MSRFIPMFPTFLWWLLEGRQRLGSLHPHGLKVPRCSCEVVWATLGSPSTVFSNQLSVLLQFGLAICQFVHQSIDRTKEIQRLDALMPMQNKCLSHYKGR